jgi:hypothetical protein
MRRWCHAINRVSPQIARECEILAQGRRALKFGNQKINLQYLGQERRNNAAIGSGDLCLIATQPLAEVIEYLNAQSVTILEGPVEKSGMPDENYSLGAASP